MIQSTRTHEVIISTGCNCQSIQHMQGQVGFRCDKKDSFCSPRKFSGRLSPAIAFLKTRALVLHPEPAPVEGGCVWG
jgi:hypothetical protein